MSEPFHTCFFIEEDTAVLITSKDIILLRPQEMTTVFASGEDQSLVKIKCAEEINQKAQALFYFAMTDQMQRNDHVYAFSYTNGIP